MNPMHAAELAQALFEDNSDALFLIDVDSQRVVEANPAAARLTNRAAEVFSGLPLVELLKIPNSSDVEVFTAALASGLRYSSPDGFELAGDVGFEPIPVEISLRPLPESRRAWLHARDARPRLRTEERAALAETELALVLNTVAVAVWCAERDLDIPLPSATEDLQGWRFRYLAPAMQRVVGWPLDYFLDGPHRFTDIIHPDDRNAVLSERATFLLSPEDFLSMEMRVIGQDGIERWVRSEMLATRDAQGRAVRLDGTVTEITRSKLAELSLRESQNWLTRILETSANGVLILDLNGCISFVNQAAEKLLGMSHVELMDRDWNSLPWHREEDHEEHIKDLLSQTLTNGDLLFDRPDGMQVAITMNAAPLRGAIGRITGVVITLFDLTHRKRAEESIKRSEDRFRRLFERNLAGVCRYTIEGKFVEANKAYANMFGYDRPEEMRVVLGRELYFSEQERIEKLARLREQGFNANFEARRRRRDGAEVWVLENVTLITEGGRQFIESTVIDITERKRAEQKLNNEHSLLHSLLHSIPDFIFFKDREGRYQGCNPAFEIYSGRKQAEIVGRTIEELFSVEQAVVMADEDRQVYETGKPMRLEKTLELGDQLHSVELVLNPLMNEQGKILGLLGIGRDITERRTLEEQLRQTGKMEAIGRLAGGIAHDFNNLLTIILGNLTLARNILTGNRDVQDLLSDSEQAAQRAAELTNQLLGFSRRHPFAVQSLDLNRRVSDTANLIRRTIDPRIQLETRLAPDLWAIEADGGQMSQVLMNLCLNARDALPNGGHVLIETANVTLTAGDIGRNMDARTGEFVRISLSDDGPGILPEVQARIFEPFFTTKPFGKGTGLGLAVVFGIVRQHQGWIECQSEPNRGTRFIIHLPRSAKAVAFPKAVPSNLPVSGTETILFVDDEPMIRELGRAVLTKQGYQVLLAEDGAVAVEQFRQHGERIDLIVLDLSMPNMSGKEAFRHIRMMDPRARVLFASGFSGDQFEPGELDGVLGFIPKPYLPSDLTRAIRTALDQSPVGGAVMVVAPERTPIGNV